MSSVFEGFPTLIFSYCRNQFLSDSLVTRLLLAAFTICFIFTFLSALAAKHRECARKRGVTSCSLEQKLSQDARSGCRNPQTQRKQVSHSCRVWVVSLDTLNESVTQ